MTALALTLVLAAAFAHSLWNFLAKKASGGLPFVWIFTGLASLIYFPVATGVFLIQKPRLGLPNLLMILATAAVHSAYFLLLDMAYRTGDMSLAYPIARGTGPLLSAAAGILLLNERPSPMALAGIGLMISGMLLLTGNAAALKHPGTRRVILYALACGATISLYTVLDKVSVSRLGTPPLILDWGTNFGRFLILTPVALRDISSVQEQWRLNRKRAFGVALLSPLAYILILTAMATCPVSYVAPAREISILIGSIMGARLLSEQQAAVRIAGSAAMVVGLIALALG